MFFKKKSKYEVKPEENIPSKLYGVYLPENEDNDSNDYRRDPRENIPTDLYGVYYPNTEDSNKISEYNVAPKGNRPQILYGPMPWMEELKK